MLLPACVIRLPSMTTVAFGCGGPLPSIRFAFRSTTRVVSAIATGLVIDDAVVITENIVRHLGFTPDRDRAIDRMLRALSEFEVAGIKTTIPLFRDLVNDPDIISGNYDIHWLEKRLAG